MYKFELSSSHQIPFITMFTDREKSFVAEVYMKTGSFKQSKIEFQNPLDFFLLGHLKDYVYTETTDEELKSWRMPSSAISE